MSGFGEYSISGKVCWATALRLFLLPFIALGAMFFCGVRGTVLVTNTIAAAAPLPGTTMFALKFHQDTELSAQMVSITTKGRDCMMPLVVGVAQFLA